MPRNGSGVYSLPAGSTVTNGDTSDATDINTPLADIVTDLNAARPVVAGGTGATTAADARTNLGVQAAFDQTLNTTDSVNFVGVEATGTIKSTGDQIVGINGSQGSAETNPSFTFNGQQSTTGMFLAANNTLAFATSGSESFRVDSSGRILVGSTSANTNLVNMVIGNGATGATVQSAAGNLVIDDNTNAGMTLLTGNTSNSLIYFADTDSTQVGRIQYSHSADTMTFMAGATDSFRISSSGVEIWDGASWVEPVTREVETAVNTNGASAYGFTGIPSGINKIEFILERVTLGTGQMLVQVGTSSGYTTTGYDSASADAAGAVDSTTGFVLYNSTGPVNGTMTLRRIRDNIWVADHSAHRDTANNGIYGGGEINLGAALDRVRITSSGGANFSAGFVNVFYS